MARSSDRSSRPHPSPDAVPLPAHRHPSQPFRLPRRTGGLTGPMTQAIAGAFEHILRFPTLNQIYRQTSQLQDDRHFVDKVLTVLGVRWSVSESDLKRIPTSGPVVVVCNHPFGGIDGIVLAAILRSIRPDVRIMANYLLSAIPELNDTMIYVDPFERPDSAARNLKAIRSSTQWLSREKGLLAIFPAGEVASLDLKNRHVTDRPWNDMAARLARKYDATVVPIYFHGRNTALFQLAGLIHPILRTTLLPHEMLKRRRSTIHVRIGSPILPARLKTFDSDVQATAFMRLRTYVLRSRAGAETAPPPLSWPMIFPGLRNLPGSDSIHHGASPAKLEPLAEPVDAHTLAWEVSKLPPTATLLQSNHFDVILFNASQAPHLLEEIGRLRELTFRLVHEGTGKSTDLDRFDPDYLHLIVWDRSTRMIVGAYRLGLTDQLLEKYGLEGLYTQTLFGYGPKLLSQISPALELGRSFIRPEYQKAFAPLLLLWKGIGQFIVANPKYRHLFGPVSINSQYQSISKQLIVSFLEATSLRLDLVGLVKPKNPPRRRDISCGELRAVTTVVQDLDEVSSLIGEIEADHKGLPILLKQYMKLNGRLLGFNIDPDFGHVLDGLILIDLLKTDRRIIEKYFGSVAAAQSFFDHHRGGQSRTEVS